MGSILRFLRQVVGDKVDMFVDQHGVLNLQREGQVAQPVGMPAELIPALRPVIETQPVNVAVVPGYDVDVTLKVGRFNHLPYSVRWDRKSGDDWIAYDDSDSETFRLSNVLDSAQVRGVVSNAYGDEISDTITVTPLEITKQPKSNEFYEDGPATFTTEFNVPPDRIEWCLVDGESRTPIADTDAATLTKSKVTKSADNGTQYVCRAYAGTGMLESDVVTLNVWAPTDIVDDDYIQLDAYSGTFIDTLGEDANSVAQRDGDLVGTWRSRAGQNFTAEQLSYRAKLGIENGKTFVRFSGGQILTIKDTPFLRNKEACVAVIAMRVNVPSTSGQSTRILQIQTATPSTRFDVGEAYQNGTSRYLSGWRRHDGNVGMNAFSVPASTDWVIVTVCVDYKTGGIGASTIAVNGVYAAQANVDSSGNTSDTNSPRICVGGSMTDVAADAFSRCDVAEMIVFNSDISSEHVRRCEEYLASKHGITLAELEFAV